MEKIRRYGTAFGGSLVVASLVNARLYADDEISPALLAWMQQATGHHWLTHGIVVLLLFLLLGLAFAGLASILAGRLGGKSMAASSAAPVLVGSALLAGLLLL